MLWIPCFKKQSHLKKCEDLIVFINRFMNPAASHLANREELCGVVPNGRFLQEGGWAQELSAKEKKGLFTSKTNKRLISGKVTFPGQKIPDQLELHFWGKLKLVFSDAILGPWFSS